MNDSLQKIIGEVQNKLQKNFLKIYNEELLHAPENQELNKALADKAVLESQIQELYRQIELLEEKIYTLSVPISEDQKKPEFWNTLTGKDFYNSYKHQVEAFERSKLSTEFKLFQEFWDYKKSITLNLSLCTTPEKQAEVTKKIITGLSKFAKVPAVID